jgi:hypothetical protein
MSGVAAFFTAFIVGFISFILANLPELRNAPVEVMSVSAIGGLVNSFLVTIAFVLTYPIRIFGNSNPAPRFYLEPILIVLLAFTLTFVSWSISPFDAFLGSLFPPAHFGSSGFFISMFIAVFVASVIYRIGYFLIVEVGSHLTKWIMQDRGA